MSLKFAAKVPGAARNLSDVDMNFSYADAFGIESPDAYERLLADCMVGDSTLFIRRDEVEASWRIVDSITTAWKNMPPVLSILIKRERGDHLKLMPSFKRMDASGMIRRFVGA